MAAPPSPERKPYLSWRFLAFPDRPKLPETACLEAFQAKWGHHACSRFGLIWNRLQQATRKVAISAGRCIAAAPASGFFVSGCDSQVASRPGWRSPQRAQTRAAIADPQSGSAAQVQLFFKLLLVLGTGLEPARLAATASKTVVYAIPPPERFNDSCD